MGIKVGINGYGRIGRNVVRAIHESGRAGEFDVIALNDLGDTQALIGLIWDHETSETIFTLEASRRLGETWLLLLEGRAFAGAEALNRDDPFDPANKGASVARDDYIELELTKYF